MSHQFPRFARFNAFTHRTKIDFDAHKKILDEVIKAASGGVEDGVPEVDLLPF